MFARFQRILKPKRAAQVESQAGVLIVGLGNPGREYIHTRHNIGFLAVDALAADLGIPMTRMQFKAITGSGSLDGLRIILAKPQTYMNLSGTAVGALLKFYKLPLDRLLVIHDDLDLPFGSVRLRPGGGSAGQKGLGSTIERLGTQAFPRMRLGIGRPPGQMDSKAYVLQDFSTADQPLLQEVLSQAVQAAREFSLNGLDAAMNKFNATLS